MYVKCLFHWNNSNHLMIILVYHPNITFSIHDNSGCTVHHTIANHVLPCKMINSMEFSLINAISTTCITNWLYPDSKVHRANMGPTWVLSAPGGPHVGPMDLAIGGIGSLVFFPIISLYIFGQHFYCFGMNVNTFSSEQLTKRKNNS